MMSDSGKHSDFLAKKARNARRKRQRILRNRSLMDNLTPEIDRNFVEDAGACKGKKRPAAADADFGDFLPNVSSSFEEEESESSLINYVSHGTISLIGRRRVMEDTVTVVPGGELAIFAVYDGHGGDRVSKACHLRLHQLVLEKIDGQIMLDGCSGDRKWEKVMKECFSKMDEEVNCSGGDGGGGMEGCSSAVRGKTIGSTAVVAVVGKNEVVVANCGDSRAVLCRGGIPVALSHDHKVTRVIGILF